MSCSFCLYCCVLKIGRRHTHTLNKPEKRQEGTEIPTTTNTQVQNDSTRKKNRRIDREEKRETEEEKEEDRRNA